MHKPNVAENLLDGPVLLQLVRLHHNHARAPHNGPSSLVLHMSWQIESNFDKQNCSKLQRSTNLCNLCTINGNQYCIGLIDNCLFHKIMSNNGIIATFPKYPENKTMVLLYMAR